MNKKLIIYVKKYTTTLNDDWISLSTNNGFTEFFLVSYIQDGDYLHFRKVSQDAILAALTKIFDTPTPIPNDYKLLFSQEICIYGSIDKSSGEFEPNSRKIYKGITKEISQSEINQFFQLLQQVKISNKPQIDKQLERQTEKKTNPDEMIFYVSITRGVESDCFVIANNQLSSQKIEQAIPKQGVKKLDTGLYNTVCLMISAKILSMIALYKKSSCKFLFDMEAKVAESESGEKSRTVTAKTLTETEINMFLAIRKRLNFLLSPTTSDAQKEELFIFKK